MIDIDIEKKALFRLEQNIEKRKPGQPAFVVHPGPTGRMTKGDKLRARRERLKGLSKN